MHFLVRCVMHSQWKHAEDETTRMKFLNRRWYILILIRVYILIVLSAMQHGEKNIVSDLETSVCMYTTKAPLFVNVACLTSSSMRLTTCQLHCIATRIGRCRYGTKWTRYMNVLYAICYEIIWTCRKCHQRTSNKYVWGNKPKNMGIFVP